MKVAQIYTGLSLGYHIKHILRSFASLLTASFVVVTRLYTNRVMRLVVRHAGLLKPLQLGQKSSHRSNKVWAGTKEGQIEPETLIAPTSIQRSAENPQTPVEEESCAQDEQEEIQDAIADDPFMQLSNEGESSPPVEPPTQNKFSAAVARTILERLRSLGIPPTTEVRSLVAQTPIAQLKSNISALEEESASKGLKSPIAAFKYFVTNNCQPRNDRQSWWNRAAVALGKERRNLLIQSVFEYAGEVVVLFTNAQRITLTQAQGMTWEAITSLGEMP